MSDNEPTTYTIIRVDGSLEPHFVAWPKEPGYDMLKSVIQPLLDGAHMEHVSVLHDGQKRDMFVDDEGRLKGLPRNDAATAIYRANWLSKHPDTEPELLSAIYGTAILFHRIVWY